MFFGLVLKCAPVQHVTQYVKYRLDMLIFDVKDIHDADANFGFVRMVETRLTRYVPSLDVIYPTAPGRHFWCAHDVCW